MSRNVNMAEAKAKLSELADVAAGGEEVVLTRRGKPIARIVPLERKEPRKPGLLKHWYVASDAFDVVDPEEQAWLEGEWTDEYGITLPNAPSMREP